MKLPSSSLLIGIGLFLASLVASCAKAGSTSSNGNVLKHGLTVDGGEICNVDAKGNSQCLPLGEKTLVFIEKVKGELTLSSRKVEGVIDPSKLAGQSEVAVLSAALLKHGVAFSFDPKTQQLAWDGDTISVIEIQTGKALQGYLTSNAMGVTITQETPESAATAAIVGLTICDKPVDVRHVVRELTNGQTTREMVIFYNYNTNLYVSRDGGLSILLEKPAVLELDAFGIIGITVQFPKVSEVQSGSSMPSVFRAPLHNP